MTKAPEDEAVVEVGAGALAEAAEAGSVEDSEEAGEGEDQQLGSRLPQPPLLSIWGSGLFLLWP